MFHAHFFGSFYSYTKDIFIAADVAAWASHVYGMITAMIDHAAAHHRNDFQKIAVVKNSDPPIFRPEQHYFNTKTERFQLQGDTELYDVLIPGDAHRGPGLIGCRKCRKFTIDINDTRGFTLSVDSLSPSLAD